MDKRIGAQLYTLRDFCKTAEDLDSTFAKLKEIGYQVVQASAIGPIPPETVKETADRYGLSVVCTHRPYTEFTEQLPQLINAHHVMNCKIAGIGGLPVEFRSGAEAIKKFIAAINPVCKQLKAEGIQFAYHNHSFEFAKTDGKYLMDYLLENTDPDEFKFIVDVYWLAFAGIDPAGFIEKLGSRVAAVHFKDLAVNSTNEVFMTEVMEGNLDWDKIIAASEKSGAQYALVEQDICQRDPFESMKISYDNLQGKGFC